MTRQAILIGAPSVKPVLSGVRQDLKDIKAFLLSNSGGAWREDEIITLIDPSPHEVQAFVNASKSKDYVFITCSGHGEHQIGKNLDETVMYLNEEETISINNINPQNKRHLIIVDVCRGIVRPVERQKAIFEASMESYSNKAYVNYRQVFDDAVMRTSEGRIVVYSCDINQSAGDDGTGGVFTQELLKSPEQFKPKNGDYRIVNIEQAFEVAKKMTYTKNAPQSAVLNAGRRRDFFPFSIVLRN